MRLADGIRKHGFKKWYERELMQSHAHMVMAFLCFIGVFAAFEVMSQGVNRLGNLAAILLCTGLGAWAVRRYIQLLTNAEATANQADCPQCGTYARFTLVQATEDGGEAVVRCRQCEKVWTIEQL
jgi:predicted Zn finger-like uncharacterized protein